MKEKKHGDGFPFAGPKGAAPGGMDKSRGNLDKDAKHKGKRHRRGRKRA